jgi:hypothetical protein
MHGSKRVSSGSVFLDYCFKGDENAADQSPWRDKGGGISVYEGPEASGVKIPPWKEWSEEDTERIMDDLLVRRRQ